MRLEVQFPLAGNALLEGQKINLCHFIHLLLKMYQTTHEHSYCISLNMNGLNDLYRTRVWSNLLDMLTKIPYLGHIIQHKNNYFKVYTQWYSLLKSTDNFHSSQVIFLIQKDKYIFVGLPLYLNAVSKSVLYHCITTSCI